MKDFRDLIWQLKDESLSIEEKERLFSTLSRDDRCVLISKVHIYGFRELHKELSAMNARLVKKREDDFRASLVDGTYEEFLAGLSLEEKEDLKILFGVGAPKSYLRGEKITIREVIDDAIAKDPNYRSDDGYRLRFTGQKTGK